MRVLYRAKCGERTWSYHVLSKCTTLPKSPHVHQHRSSLISFLVGFSGGFVAQAWWVKTLAISDWIQSSPSRERKGFLPERQDWWSECLVTLGVSDFSHIFLPSPCFFSLAFTEALSISSLIMEALNWWCLHLQRWKMDYYIFWLLWSPLTFRLLNF